MPDPRLLGQALVDLLTLGHPPIAIDFRDTEPNGNRFTGSPVVASCVFWMQAHQGGFSTAADDHHCSVGRFTHGLAEAGEIVDQPDVGALLDVGWVTMEAFAEVAHLSRRPHSIAYGPLSEAPTMPDVVLLRLSPRQMMEIGDAVDVELSGKPQCQILPRAVDRQVIAASMGCALSRARTGMSDEELTCAIPGERLEEVVAALRAVRRADDAVAALA